MTHVLIVTYLQEDRHLPVLIGTHERVLAELKRIVGDARDAQFVAEGLYCLDRDRTTFARIRPVAT